ncbi:polysaccharide biosynthesis/export family protein [bacterium BD-1]|nr:polysaccharide biosynthesis/export family protein [Ottowia caeni]
MAASCCALLCASAFAQTTSTTNYTSSYGTNAAPVGPSVTSLSTAPSAGQAPTPSSTGGYSAPRPVAVAPTPLGSAVAPSMPEGGAVVSTPVAAALSPTPTTIDADYRIGPNDLLDVEIFGVNDLKRTVRVNSTGHISLPLIGTVPVAGLTAADAQALIALQYGKDYLQDPQVSIFIKEFTTQRITIDGAVAKPGIYPMVGQITLLRALALAGGGGQLSDLEQVILFRITPDGKSETQKHDVNKIRLGEAPDPLLQGDDILVVNRDATRVGLRDSLFSDILNTLNPFSSIYTRVVP